MASTIVTKNSSTASAVPVSGDLTQGELAVNVTDKKLYTKNSGGTVVELGTTPTSLTTGAISGTTLAASGAVTFSGGTANGVAYLNGSKVVTTGSALVFDGTRLQIGMTTGTRTLSVQGQIGAYHSSGTNDSQFLMYNNGTVSALYATYGSTGAYTPIAFYTNDAEQMRLTSTGLGIGTSSPGVKLDVYGTKSLASDLGVTNIRDTASYASGNGGAIVLMGKYNSGGSYVGGAYVNAAKENATDGNYSYALTFGTNVNGGALTERARIDSSGNLLVGTTSASAFGTTYRSVVEAGAAQGAVVFKSTAGSGYETANLWNNASSGDNYFVYFRTEAGGTVRGSINYNRTAGLTAYNTTSDYRAKYIIGPVEDSGALIDSVPVYMGKMKGAIQERPMFIAHETPPYAHTGEKDAIDAEGNPIYQQMDASSLVPVMWAELQSLRKRVAQLEGQ